MNLMVLRLTYNCCRLLMVSRVLEEVSHVVGVDFNHYPLGLSSWSEGVGVKNAKWN